MRSATSELEYFNLYYSVRKIEVGAVNKILKHL